MILGCYGCREGEGIEYVAVLSNEAGQGKVIQQVGFPFNVQNQFGVHIISRVHKRNNVQIPERIYYCVSGTIYQAPSLQQLIMYRLHTASMILTRIIQCLEKLKHWNVLSSYNWKADIDPTSVLASVNNVPKGDAFDEDFISDEEDDEEMFKSTRDGTASNQESGANTAADLDVWLVPSILGDDSPSLPLSFRGLGNKTSVIYNFPSNHVASVMQNEYEQLFRASQRIASIFVAESQNRPVIEAARREVFINCHKALDELEATLLQNFRASKIPKDPQPIFGCNPPL